jgi:hypothetical protein
MGTAEVSKFPTRCSEAKLLSILGWTTDRDIQVEHPWSKSSKFKMFQNLTFSTMIQVENRTANLSWWVALKTQVYCKYFIKIPAGDVQGVYETKIHFLVSLGFHPHNISLCICKYFKICEKSEIWSTPGSMYFQ